MSGCLAKPPLFRDRFGKFSGVEGAALLEAILWRREIHQGQEILLRRRAQAKELGLLQISTAQLLLAVAEGRRKERDATRKAVAQGTPAAVPPADEHS